MKRKADLCNEQRHVRPRQISALGKRPLDAVHSTDKRARHSIVPTMQDIEMIVQHLIAREQAVEAREKAVLAREQRERASWPNIPHWTC